MNKVRNQLTKRIKQLEAQYIAVNVNRSVDSKQTVTTTVSCKHRKEMVLCNDEIDFKPGFRPYESVFIHRYQLPGDFWDEEPRIKTDGSCYICGERGEYEDPFDPKDCSVLGYSKRY